MLPSGGRFPAVEHMRLCRGVDVLRTITVDRSSLHIVTDITPLDTDQTRRSPYLLYVVFSYMGFSPRRSISGQLLTLQTLIFLLVARYHAPIPRYILNLSYPVPDMTASPGPYTAPPSMARLRPFNTRYPPHYDACYGTRYGMSYDTSMSRFCRAQQDVRWRPQLGHNRWYKFTTPSHASCELMIKQRASGSTSQSLARSRTAQSCGTRMGGRAASRSSHSRTLRP